MPHVELPQAEFKVVLLGDTNSGKTSLVLRFVEGTYKDHRNATIGAFFLTKRITVDATLCCKLLLWDTSGQDQFQRLALTYYKQAAAAIVCVDLSSNDHDRALLALQKWLEQVQTNITTHRIVLVVAGCKSDLVDQPGGASSHHQGSNVLEEQIRAVADRFGAYYVRTSAKNNQGVTQAFQRTASLVMHCQQEASAGRGRPIPVTVGGSTGGASTSASGSGAVGIRNPTKSKHHRSLSPTVKSHHQHHHGHPDEADGRNPPSSNHHRRALSAHDPASPYEDSMYGSSTAAATSFKQLPQHQHHQQHQYQQRSSYYDPENRHDKSTPPSSYSRGRDHSSYNDATNGGGGFADNNAKEYDDEDDHLRANQPPASSGGGESSASNHPNLLHQGSKIMCDNGLLLCASGNADGTTQECVIL